MQNISRASVVCDGNKVHQQYSVGIKKSSKREHEINVNKIMTVILNIHMALKYFIPTNNLNYIGLNRERKAKAKFPKE